MKEIGLTQGKVALVDDEDYEWLKQYKWCCASGKGLVYATRQSRGKSVFMHRIILNTPQGMHTDHINHDGLDNRRCNLRICTNSQNQANGNIRKDNTTGRKGTTWDKNKRKYLARIKFHGRYAHIGYFDKIEDAANAYNAKAKELFGEFAYQG